MTKQSVVVLRDGKVKMTTVLSEHADGTLWSVHGNMLPLVDGECPDISKADLARLMAIGDFDAIPASAYLHMGIQGAVEVISKDDYDTRNREAQTEFLAQHPEVVERNRIEALYAKAEGRLHDTDDDNTSDHYRLRAEADAALAAWKEKYPEAAKEERRANLIAEAVREEEIASGALTYDCDGSFDESYRQQRHDEIMAKARALREQAANL